MTHLDTPQERILRLEYMCTAEERREAATLNLRQQYGGGSKVRTWVVLIGMLVLVAWMAWEMIRQMVPEGYRMHGVVGMAAVVVVVTWIQTRLGRKATASVATRVELSEAGMRVGEGSVEIFIAWGSFAHRVESERLFVLHDQTKRLAYILPKRILPDEEWIVWLREMARSKVVSHSRADSPAAPEEPAAGVLQMEYRLGYWSMVDLLQASWMGKGVMLGWLGLHVYVIGTSIVDPMPNAKVPMWQVILYFELPAVVLGGLLLLLFIAAYSWMQHRRELTPWRVEMGEDVLRHVSGGGELVASWDGVNRYKETPWHFILWRRPGGNWFMVPKRALGGEEGVRRCRELLERRLKRSTWLTAY